MFLFMVWFLFLVILFLGVAVVILFLLWWLLWLLLLVLVFVFVVCCLFIHVFGVVAVVCRCCYCRYCCLFVCLFFVCLFVVFVLLRLSFVFLLWWLSHPATNATYYPWIMDTSLGSKAEEMRNRSHKQQTTKNIILNNNCHNSNNQPTN